MKVVRVSEFYGKLLFLAAVNDCLSKVKKVVTQAKKIIMECRPHCAACCTVISISSPIPGMPNGKPAGVRCVNLDDDLRCKIFGRPERPRICGAFQPDPLICGNSRAEAVKIMAELEEIDAGKFLDEEQ